MGWTYTNRQRGTSHERWFKDEMGDALTSEDGRGIIRLMGGQPGHNAVYGAWRLKSGAVIALVCLINWRPNRDEYYNFGYKDMSEDMGPCEHDCPEAILKLLTPIEDLKEVLGETSWGWAKEWRAQAWARIEAAKARKPLRPGAIVTFRYEIQFTDGYKCRQLQVADAKRLRFVPVGHDFHQMYWSYKLHRRNLADIQDVIYPD